MFHQAALPSVPRSVQDPLTSTEANVTGTLNVLLNARDAGRAAGRVRLLVVDLRREPGAAQARGDARAAALAVRREQARGRGLLPQLRARSTGSDCVALRYFNVFGPRQDPNSQYAAVIPNFITRAARTGERPVVYGDGEQSRDFTYVGQRRRRQRARAWTRPGVAGGVFNIACGERDHAQRAAGRDRRASPAATSSRTLRGAAGRRRAALARRHRRRRARPRLPARDRPPRGPEPDGGAPRRPARLWRRPARRDDARPSASVCCA